MSSKKQSTYKGDGGYLGMPTEIQTRPHRVSNGLVITIRQKETALVSIRAAAVANVELHERNFTRTAAVNDHTHQHMVRDKDRCDE